MDSPIDVHPALTPARLRQLGELILAARHSALEDHFPMKGDDAWSYGCTCFARSKFVIRQHAGQNGYEWLSVIAQRPEFIVGVDGVPLKFYRGEPDDPPLRAFQRRPEEFDAYQLEFENVPAADLDELLRLIVSTDSDLRVDSVWLLRLTTGGDIRDRYEIPVETQSVRSISPRKRGIDLSKPLVEPRRPSIDEDNEDRQAG